MFALSKPKHRHMECAVGKRSPSQYLYYDSDKITPQMEQSGAANAAPKPAKTTPEQMLTESMTNGPEPVGQGDYSQYIINAGLESSVIDSHRVFVKEINTSTSGASTETVLSHDDSVVPKWGLRRTTPYIPVSAHAREVPSSTDDQLKDNSTSLTYGLF